MGSCVTAHKSDAVHIGSFGAAEVGRDKCVDYGLCMKVCPLGLICITTPEHPVHTMCANQDGRAQTRKDCSVDCIVYDICIKNCPTNAVRIENNHMVIDEAGYIARDMCAAKYPGGTILDVDSTFTAKA